MKIKFTVAQYISFSVLLLSQVACTDENSSNTPSSSSATACYSIIEGDDVTAIQLTQNGESISGYYSWRPSEKDGAYGMLEGTESDGKIIANYTYIIEGSTQSEQVVFKREGNDIIQGVGELEEQGTKLLIKDINTLDWRERFTNTECATLKDALDAAKITSEEIIKNK